MISIFKLSSSFWNGDFHDCFQRGYEEKRASVGAKNAASSQLPSRSVDYFVRLIPLSIKDYH